MPSIDRGVKAKRRALILLISIFPFAMVTLLRGATFVLFDNINNNTSSDSFFVATGPFYESFSAGGSPVMLTDVMARLTADANTMAPAGGSITVGLYSDSATSPATLLLNIGTLAVNSLPVYPAYGNIDFPVNPPFALNPSARYWIGFSSTNPSRAALAYTHDTSGIGVTGEFHILGGKLYPSSAGPFQLRITASDSVAQSSGTWVQQHPQTSPSIRSGFALAYDAARGQVLLFGGSNSPGSCAMCPPLGDTWVWDGSNWTQKNPQTSPPARSDADMVYDAAHSQMVLFGGSGKLNDTWIWDGSNWTQKSSQTTPPGRIAHAMAYDAARGQVVLFGGSSSGYLNDTWVWDGSNWTQKNPQTVPPARERQRMVYDAVRGQVVMFGGVAGAGSTVGNETWVWDGSNWTQRRPQGNPPARFDFGMAYDSVRGQTTLFGGYASGSNLNDTWTWDGSNWTQQNPAVNPAGRNSHRLAYHAMHQQSVLFGGNGIPTNTPAFNDTWAWSSGPLLASVRSVSGDGQSGPVGLLLPNPVVVEVRDSQGNLAAGAIVSFAGTNATVNPAFVQTDSTGRASAQVTLGATAGAAQVTATVAGLAAVNFNFTALAAATTLTIKKTWQAAAAGNPLRGDTFTYAIQVTNTGSAAAAAVNVQDIPDTRAELTLQGPLTFSLGTLAAGAAQTLTVNASASAAGLYINTATVTWSDSSGKISMANASTSTQVDPQPGDFAASATAPVPLNTGVGQVLADGANVYVANNPGDSLTILNCASGACNVASTVALGAGSAPVAVTKMDIDGEGQNDVLVLNQGAGTIATLLSSNPGAPQVSGVGAGAVAFAPFHGADGVARVAVVFPGTVAIFAWDGQQFQPAATAVAGASPSAIANGDFNGDGWDDLLVADSASGTLQLFLGDGMGGLNAASQIAVGTNPAALATGDIDNSGALDAAVSTADGLVVLLNDGAGDLTPQPAVPTNGAGAVVLGDFNGDGNLDAAVASPNGSSVSLYRGDGSGAWLPAGVSLTGRMPVSLAASDLDNDGTADLIVGSGGSQDLTILLFPKP
ncbi:MAG TPA: FG-GAP-like repeat-containing protein [Bryobacteraceae bacterium]|nr:FG-GAP-like repeat-containing protein [Bryobacteraceae bacterium]